MSLQSSLQALAKLEPFLLLGKSARGSAAAKLIVEATAAPGCYVFAELLDLEGIQQLANDPQYSSSYRLLELFAFGTYRDYLASPPDTFPGFSQAHISKLRHLTLITLASQNRNLSYSTLIPSLGLESSGDGPSSRIHPNSMRELEDIVIDAMYAGIISARIDQRRQRLEIESVMGRDLRGNDEVLSLSHSLSNWSNTTARMLDTLASRIDEIKQKDYDRQNAGEQHDEAMEKMLLHLSTIPNPPATGDRQQYDRLGSDRYGDMDTDDDASALRRKKASASGPLRSKRSRA